LLLLGFHEESFFESKCNECEFINDRIMASPLSGIEEANEGGRKMDRKYKKGETTEGEKRVNTAPVKAFCSNNKAVINVPGACK